MALDHPFRRPKPRHRPKPKTVVDRLWRLDVVTRAVAATGPLDEEQRKAFAAVLGVPSWSPVSFARADIAAAASDAGRSDLVPPPRAPRSASEPADSRAADPAPDDVPPERTRFYRLPDPDQDERPRWLDLADQVPVGAVSEKRRRPPLIPDGRARSVLGAAMKVAPGAGEIDLPAVIRTLTAARPLRRLPMRPDWRFAQSVRVIMDTGSAMTPFGEDTRALLDALARLLGADRLTVEPVAGWPPPDTDPPHAGAAVLIVSGLGLLPADPADATARAEDWATFGMAMRRRGWTPVAFTPASPADWPAALTRSLCVVHWSETTNARQARGAVLGQRPRFAARTAARRAAQLQRMAELAAMCARIDLPSLRRLRHRVAGGPELEADFWWSSHVGSRGETGLTLDTEARAVLQARFAARQDSGTELAALARQRHHLPAHFEFEEVVTALAVTRPVGWVDAMRHHLRNATRTVVDGGSEARGFALWILKALGRLDIPEELREDAAALYYAACKRTGAVAHRDAAPGRLPAPAWLTTATRVDTGPNVALAVDWRADGVAVEQVMAVELILHREDAWAGSDSAARRVAFSPDGARIAVGCDDGSVALLNRDGADGRRMHGHDARITGLTFSPDGACLISVCADGWLGQNRTDNGAWSQTEPSPEVPLLAVAVDPTGARIAVASGDGRVHMVDPATGRTVARHQEPDNPAANLLAFGGDGQSLVVARGETVQSYRTDDRDAEPDWSWLQSGITSLAAPRRGSRVLVGCENGTVSICSVEDLEIVQSYAATAGAAITSLAVPDYGGWAVAGTADGTIAVFDTSSGREVAVMTVDGPVDALALDRDGIRLAIAHTRLTICDLDWSRAVLSEESSADPASVHLLWPAERGRVLLPVSEAGWLRAAPEGLIRRARTLAPGNPPARLGPARWIDMAAPDSSRFRLEDADSADGRRPLHVGIVTHPRDMQRAAPILDALEERVRAHAGLPACAHVLQRDLGAWDANPEHALDRALARAEGCATVVLLASRSLVGDEAARAGLQRLGQMMTVRPPDVVILCESDRETAGNILRDELHMRYPITVRMEDPTLFDPAPVPVAPGSLLAIMFDSETQYDDAYCDSVERLVQDIQLRDDGTEILPICQDPQASFRWVADSMPTLWTYQILRALPGKDTGLAEQIEQAAARIRPDPIVPLWLDGRIDDAAELLDAFPRDWPDWMPSDRIDDAARRIADEWRHGRLAVGIGVPDDNPSAYGRAVAELLQAMTMTFHLDRFVDRIGHRDSGFDLSGIGVVETAAPEGEDSPERQILQHFLFLSEYYHAGPVTAFIEDGIDPWRIPERSRISHALEYELMNVHEENPDAPGIDLRQVFRAFDRFAPPHERAELVRIFGEIEPLLTYDWRKVFTDDTIADRIHRHDHHRVADMLRPYACEGMGYYANVPTTEPPPVTFVEDVERYQGRFLGYLRGIAGAFPDSLATVPLDTWKSAEWLFRSPGREELGQYFDAVEPGPDGSQSVAMPVAAFHDVAAQFCEQMISVVRWRHAEGPEEPQKESMSAAQA